jgi:hypothetical protein
MRLSDLSICAAWACLVFGFGLVATKTHMGFGSLLCMSGFIHMLCWLALRDEGDR